MIIHENDWHGFKTDTIITNDGFGMISVDYYKDKPETGFIHDLSVIPFARKGGMGKALLKAAIEKAKERNCKKVELNWNSQASPMWVFEWYERNGFKEIEFGRFNHLMRKVL